MAARWLITWESLPQTMRELTAGVNLAEIANRAGVAEETIKPWRRGTARPTLFVLLCVLEPMGYCVECDGELVTAGNVFDWIEQRFVPEEAQTYRVNRKTIANWRDGFDPQLKPLIQALDAIGLKLEIVRRPA